MPIPFPRDGEGRVTALRVPAELCVSFSGLKTALLATRSSIRLGRIDRVRVTRATR